LIEIVWEFHVRPEAIAAFRKVYRGDGDWAALFARHAGYEGTTLLQDVAAPERFLTIDRWQSQSHFDAMHASAKEDYARLDAACEGFTVAERKLGVFETA
jgi:heme-degrading monooxygenase HmoA